MSWPAPMDGERRSARRSTDDDVTQYLPRMDDDRLGLAERFVATVERDQRQMLTQVGPRHRQDDDLPGPSRRELARLVRQVRALGITSIAIQPVLCVALGWYVAR